MPEETKDALSITAGSKIQILHSKEDKKNLWSSFFPEAIQNDKEHQSSFFYNTITESYFS